MTNAQREIIRQGCGLLGAAMTQSVPTDDQIIMGDVREAHAVLRTLFFAPTEEEVREDLGGALANLAAEVERMGRCTCHEPACPLYAGGAIIV